MNRIEQLISDMEQYIDSCKAQAFSGNRKIVVDRGAVDDFLAELRMCLPEVIQRSEKIVNNKEAIISDAQTQADKLLNDATLKTSELIDEHEIVQQAIVRGNEIVSQAQEQAQDILDQAIREANAYKDSAINYTGSSMSALQEIYSDNISITRNLFQQHLDAMEERYEIITANCNAFQDAVNASLNSSEEDARPQQEEDPQEDEDTAE